MVDGVGAIFALHCDPNLEVGSIGLSAGPDHLGGRPRRHPAQGPRWPHGPAAPHRRPGPRHRQAGHRPARRAGEAERQPGRGEPHLRRRSRPATRPTSSPPRPGSAARCAPPGRDELGAGGPELRDAHRRDRRAVRRHLGARPPRRRPAHRERPVGGRRSCRTRRRPTCRGAGTCVPTVQSGGARTSRGSSTACRGAYARLGVRTPGAPVVDIHAERLRRRRAGDPARRPSARGARPWPRWPRSPPDPATVTSTVGPRLRPARRRPSPRSRSSHATRPGCWSTRPGRAAGPPHGGRPAGARRPGRLLVVNDTRVIPARLRLRKPTGGAVEVLLLERRAGGRWEALVRPSRRVPPGTDARADGRPAVEVGDDLGDGGGGRSVEVAGRRRRSRHGEVPLPPYIHEPLADPERYQTVYARRPGVGGGADRRPAPHRRRCSTAAAAAGVEVATVELDVGLGTFRPITTDRVEDHPMHAERYDVPAATLERVPGRPSGWSPSAPRSCGRSSRRPRRARRRAGPSCSSTATTSSGWSTGCSPTSTCPARRCSRWSTPSSGPAGGELYDTALGRGLPLPVSFGDAMLLDRRWGRAA